jgi:stage II sporulation protein D
MRGSTFHFAHFLPWMLMLISGFPAAGCGRKRITTPPPAAAPPRTEKPSAPPRTQPAPPAAVPAPKTGTASDTAGRPAAAEPTLRTGIPGPSIRIGLTVPAGDLRISSRGAFVLVEKTPETPRWSLAGQVQVRRERPASDAAEIYRVQVASLANAAAADKLGRELGNRFSVPSVVYENTATGTSQVRLGSFTAREEAQEFASGPIALAGYRDAFVVREAGGTTRGEVMLTLRGPEGFFRLSRSGYLFLPDSGASLLELNGKPYRGTLDVSLGKDGRVIVVNQLGMEEYLMGVVPAELSPVAYPEEEALAAQAIAARTYALKNMGRFRADGFDLTDDASTQVYGGASLEKAVSSDAVLRTAGIAIHYGGKLIDAMYMSTCGGRTENFSDVFDTAPVPYLTSVFCTVDNSSAEASGRHLAGSHDLNQVFLADDGSAANREIELARVLELIQPDAASPEMLAAAAGTEEIRQWIQKARRNMGGDEIQAATQPADLNLRAGFFQFAAERIFGRAEISRSISPSDATYYLSNLADGAAIPSQARNAFAYLVQKRLWQPYPDNTARADQAIRRGDALTLLIRWILSVRPEILKTAIAADPAPNIPGAAAENTLAIQRGNRTDPLRLARFVRLFKNSGARSLPVAELHLIGGERLRYHQNPAGEVDFIDIELSPTGAASDRFSPQASWQVSMTRAAAAEKLRPLAGSIGEIRDLKPARFGASGRVVQVEIIGSRGSAIVNGYKVRGALGLKDTLYTLSRTTADDGSVASFNFDGRGWGHGIGLCQTGAVGMAKAGRTAEEILKTYYQGVELRRVYGP